ncbi:hypothetical protein [Pantoea ananatis]|uniref:hypothetical protein n=1 Tax=Pantoea ananas TaxID=553 RepID=UPI001B30061A|nr:hypothetical protein [Pantoea ananatis]
MSESTDLDLVEIKPEQAPALYVKNGLDAYLDQIRQFAKEVPDVSTKKGRDRIGSLARSVGASKKAIEEPGRAYLRHLKEAVKPAEEELRRFTRECDLIRDAILAPRAEWEVEQERIKAEEEARIAAEKLAAQIESDHEIALLMDEKIDRDRAEAAAEEERQRIAHEEEIRRQAAEQARIEAEQAAQRERDAAAKREADLQAAKEKAEADAKAAQERAEREKREAAELAERQRIEAAQRAEREKQEAIEAERRKAEAVEAARKAEEKRIADEAAARAANEAHRKAIGTAVVNALIAHAGLSRDDAIKTLVALKDDLILHTSITY